MQDETSDIGHSCKSDSAENTLHCSSPLFSSLYSLLSCCHTERATNHKLLMDEKMLFASSAKLASLKAAKPSRAKGRKRWMCHHPWASVAFIKQTEREIQGLKGITDQRRDKSPSQGKELFFAIKEEKHGSEVGSHGAPIVKKLHFYLDERSCKAG